VGIGALANPIAGSIQITSDGFIKEAVSGQPSTGQLLLADNINPGSISNGANVEGGIFSNQSQVTSALATVNSLSSTLAGEAGTALTINPGTNGQTVHASSGTLDASGNRVFTIAGNAFTNNSHGLTIQGGANDYVVLNINNGTSNEALGGSISLSGGITSDHLLFNFTGSSGNLQASTGGAEVFGILLAPI
jgi:hypothetical protein